jgi:prepilin-type N-terminal cleavage/methylation domain-containing protein
MIFRRFRSSSNTAGFRRSTIWKAGFPDSDRVTSQRRMLHHTSHSRAFTLIELLVVSAILSILVGLLASSVQKLRDSIHQAAMRSDLTELCARMHGIFEADGDYPLSIEDSRFTDSEVDPASRLSAGLITRIEQSLQADARSLPYYVVSVRPGTPGQPGTWNFRIATGPGDNPVKFGSSITFDPGYVIDPDGVIRQANIFRDGADIFLNESELDPKKPNHYWWPWGLPLAPPRRPINQLQAQVTVRAAELVTPMLEAHPEAASQIRPFLAANATQVLQQFTPAWFDPFQDILSLSDDEIAALEDMDLTRLPGDPAYLFSYDALRVLCSIYSDDDGVADGLIAKLDAAEDSEARGNLNAKRGQIKAFQNQVSAQAGKALSVNQARVLMALSKTL